MQNFTTILDIIDIRQRGVSYNDCCNQYHIDHSTVRLIMSVFEKMGKDHSELQ